MNRNTFNRFLVIACAALSVAATPALAAWPDGKPINIVVPYAPGGTADALARLIAQHLGPKLATSVVVVNKAGASGIIGEQAVVQAAPDGFTVLYDATPMSINPHLQKLPFDPEKDLVPVTQVGVTPMLMTVSKTSPYATGQDLIKVAKQAPGKLTFGSGGQGTVQYMAPELMNQAVGISMLHVPYKSGGLALTAALAGEVDMGFFNLPAVGGHVKNGLLKALAITAAQRSSLFPDVPTVAEIIGKPYEVYEWNGVFVPRGTPTDIVTRLHSALREVLAVPEVKAKFDSLGSRIVASTPDEFKKQLAAESSRWAATVKAAGIKKE
ncbi:MAG: tripartite tricarboxylate transporter substrate binding protein [Betaproteobacteria bacterium]|jgi:tripartite-type tricarboxylate transporter receptor subunit TctC|nr:tripartite tricarboxylate transporter substrate binding protein [Betaproteobacteria bacterium]